MSNKPINPENSSQKEDSEKQLTENEATPKSLNQDDDLDFVVTEAHSTSPELVGGLSSPPKPPDDLNLESTSDLMEKEARCEASSLNPAEFNQLPNESNPILKNQIPKAHEEPERFEKLADKRIQEISNQMKGGKNSEGYLTQQEKYDLIQGMEKSIVNPKQTKETSAPIKKDKPKSQAKFSQQFHKANKTQNNIPERRDPIIADRVRGIAYYSHQFIQVTGEQVLHDQDEMTINGRAYLLKPKKVSNRFLWSVLGPIAAIAIFAAGTFFSSNANTGVGQIVGIALDDQGYPYLKGAMIKIVDIGKSIESNNQGFFRTDPIETGSHKIELLINGEVIGTDYATVVSGKITTLTLHPSKDEITQPSWSDGQRTPGTAQNDLSNPKSKSQISSPSEVRSSSNPKTHAAVEKEDSKKQSSRKTAKNKNRKKTKSTSTYSKLKLDANVKGAKLTLDGSVVGAGNLTFSRLKPGKHRYKISKEGYQSAEGTINLKSGKVVNLAVVMDAKSHEKNQQDYLYSGRNNQEKGEFTAAISDYNEAIRIDPSYVDAYLERASVYKKQKMSDDAYSDYIRAAEILQINKYNSRALSAFDKAVDIQPKSIPAHLGRGRLYLIQNQEIAAIADFDYVISHDKRNLEGYLGLGEARYNQGYYKKAVKRFKDARSISPKKPEIHQNLMLSYLALSDMKNVRKSYDKFQKYASQEQAQQMQSDPKFSAVLQVVNR